MSPDDRIFHKNPEENCQNSAEMDFLLRSGCKIFMT